MALINCAECGNQVSDSAASCPKCGAPVAAMLSPATRPQARIRAVTFTPMAVAAIVAAVIFVLVMVIVVRAQQQRPDRAWADSQATDAARTKDRRAVEYCDDRYKEMNADRQYTPAMLQFHSQACRKMRDDYRLRWGRDP